MYPRTRISSPLLRLAQAASLGLAVAWVASSTGWAADREDLLLDLEFAADTKVHAGDTVSYSSRGINGSGRIDLSSTGARVIVDWRGGAAADVLFRWDNSLGEKCSLERAASRLLEHIMLNERALSLETPMEMEVGSKWLPGSDNDSDESWKNTPAGSVFADLLAAGAAYQSEGADGSEICMDPLLSPAEMGALLEDAFESDPLADGTSTTTETSTAGGGKTETTTTANGKGRTKIVEVKFDASGNKVSEKTTTITKTTGQSANGDKLEITNTGVEETDGEGNLTSASDTTMVANLETGSYSYTANFDTDGDGQTDTTTQAEVYDDGSGVKAVTEYHGDNTATKTWYMIDGKSGKVTKLGKKKQSGGSVFTPSGQSMNFPPLCIPTNVVGGVLNWNLLAAAVTDPDPNADNGEEGYSQQVDLAPICGPDQNKWESETSGKYVLQFDPRWAIDPTPRD